MGTFSTNVIFDEIIFTDRKRHECVFLDNLSACVDKSVWVKLGWLNPEIRVHMYGIKVRNNEGVLGYLVSRKFRIH